MVLSTYKALAKFLGVSVSTVKRKRDEIPCFYLGSKRLWSTEVLAKWIEEGGTKHG